MRFERTKGKKIRRIMASALAALLCLAFMGVATGEGWERYDQESGKTMSSPFMWYWVYTPENMRPGLPLVIYLHSTRGIMKHALDESLPSLIIDGTIPSPDAVVLVPQLPGYYDADWYDAFDSLNTLIGRVIGDFEVDPDRIALTAFSLGANVEFDIAYSTPGRYARILSICGKVSSLKVLYHPEIFEGSEVKVFTGKGDLAVNTSRTVNLVKAMQEIGLPASNEEIDLPHMEVPVEVFKRKEIQEWLWLVSENITADEMKSEETEDPDVLDNEDAPQADNPDVDPVAAGGGSDSGK